MEKSWKLARGVVVFAGAAVIGCGAPDRGDDRAARRAADQATTETHSGALTTSLFQPYVAYPTGSGAEVVGIGDLDGDGRNDIAVLTSSNNDPANDYMVHVFLQDIDGSLKPRVKYPVGARGRFDGYRRCQRRRPRRRGGRPLLRVPDRRAAPERDGDPRPDGRVLDPQREPSEGRRLQWGRSHGHRGNCLRRPRERPLYCFCKPTPGHWRRRSPTTFHLAVGTS